MPVFDPTMAFAADYSFSETGKSLSDPASYSTLSQGMKDLVYKEPIEFLMMYYGIPRKREVSSQGESSTTLMWIYNRDNPEAFLEYNIIPAHIPMLEQYFIKLGKPFRGGFLAAKQYYDATRPAKPTERQSKFKTDAITGQLINDKGEPIDEQGNVLNIATSEPITDNIPKSNRNAYGFEIPIANQDGGSGSTNSESNNDNNANNSIGIPSNGQVEGTFGQTVASVQAPMIRETIPGNDSGQDLTSSQSNEENNGV